MGPPCFRQCRDPRPEPGRRAAGPLRPPPTRLSPSKDEGRAESRQPPSPHTECVGAHGAFHRWSHTPSTAQEADFLHPEYEPREGPAGSGAVETPPDWITASAESAPQLPRTYTRPRNPKAKALSAARGLTRGLRLRPPPWPARQESGRRGPLAGPETWAQRHGQEPEGRVRGLLGGLCALPPRATPETGSGVPGSRRALLTPHWPPPCPLPRAAHQMRLPGDQEAHPPAPAPQVEGQASA